MHKINNRMTQLVYMISNALWGNLIFHADLEIEATVFLCLSITHEP